MILKELKKLDSTNVLSYLSEEEIYRFYFSKDFKFDVPFSSPFRDDKHPSFIISKKTLRFKDFAMGDTGNCFNFVMNLYGIDYNKALIQIVTDFNIRSEFQINDPGYYLSTSKAEYKNASNKVYEGNVELKIKKRDWNCKDLEYWGKYGITETILRLGWVFPISHYFLNGKPYIAEKLSYAYVEKKDGKITYKIYQPLSVYKKFISGNDSSVWELWHLLPKTGDKLIITSSRKDALCIISNFGVPAVSLQAESVMPKSAVIKDILNRFKQVYLFYDNDYQNKENNGQIMAKKLYDKHSGLVNIFIPEEYKSKDISDLREKDMLLAKVVFNELINE